MFARWVWCKCLLISQLKGWDTSIYDLGLFFVTFYFLDNSNKKPDDNDDDNYDDGDNDSQLLMFKS